MRRPEPFELRSMDSRGRLSPHGPLSDSSRVPTWFSFGANGLRGVGLQSVRPGTILAVREELVDLSKEFGDPLRV